MLGMTKAQLSSITQEDIIALYDSYHAGNVTPKDYAQFFVELLENYIKKRIALKHRTLGAEYDDLMQSARMIIVTQVESYDPRQGVIPSTYFTKYIDQATKDCVRNNNPKMTTHYTAKLHTLIKAAKENGYIGIDDPRLTPQILSIISDVPLTTVVRVLEQENREMVSLDTFEDNVRDSRHTPEEGYFKNERKVVLERLIEKCTALERFLLDKMILESHPTNYRTLLAVLKSEEAQKHFGCELPKELSQKFLQQKLNHALRRIRNAPEFHRSVAFREDLWKPVFAEQATAEDIENNFIFDE